MPRRQKDTSKEQDRESTNNRKISARPRGRKFAVSSMLENPISKITMNNRVQSSTVTPRSTAFAPPNNIILSESTLPSISNGATLNVVASALSLTPRNFSTLGFVNNNQLRRPEIIFIRRPLNTNETTEDPLGTQENDDVTYLYTVDTSAAGRVVEEVDLSQESEEVEEEGRSEKKQTATKSQKNRKRKAEGDEVSNKRNPLKNAPVCSVCYTHYDSLIDNDEHMLVVNCGHPICRPCTRKTKLTECHTCGEQINRMCRVFF